MLLFMLVFNAANTSFLNIKQAAAEFPGSLHGNEREARYTAAQHGSGWKKAHIEPKRLAPR